MKALLTSDGLSNEALFVAFDRLRGSNPWRGDVAFIPTGAWPIAGDKTWLLMNLEQLQRIGSSLDIVEPAVLHEPEWLSRLAHAELIAVGGGDAAFALAQFHRAGVVRALRELLPHRIYIGISAGTVIAGRDIRWLYEIYDRPIDGDDVTALGVVDAAIHPHRGQDAPPTVGPFANAAADLTCPAFEIEDGAAVLVDGDTIETMGICRRLN